MSKQYYIPEQDNDIALPALREDGKPLILPAFICGVKIEEFTSKQQEKLQKISFEFEIHNSIENIKDITVFKEDENGNIDYSSPSGTVNASVFKKRRIKGGELWKNLTKSSGKMNRIFTSSLPNYGIKIEEEEIEIDGQKMKALVIPDLTEEMFLGKGVFIKLGVESYTSKRGNLVQLTKVKSVISNLNKFEDEIVITNSLKEQKQNNSTTAQKVFEDVEEFDEDSLPF